MLCNARVYSFTPYPSLRFKPMITAFCPLFQVTRSLPDSFSSAPVNKVAYVSRSQFVCGAEVYFLHSSYVLLIGVLASVTNRDEFPFQGCFLTNRLRNTRETELCDNNKSFSCQKRKLIKITKYLYLKYALYFNVPLSRILLSLLPVLGVGLWNTLEMRWR